MAALCELFKKVGITESNFDDFSKDSGNLRTNSLECERGDTFIALKGERFDGHDFIPTAISRGAGLIVCERVTPYLAKHPEVRYVTVKNARLAAAHMWNELCDCPADKLITVAVTGTNGKTSTTFFLREIFKKAGYVTGVIGTVRCFIGEHSEALTDDSVSSVNSMTTPPPEVLYPTLARMVSAGVEIVFMEASSHALCQYRLDPIRFTLGIFTGLTRDHLDYHGDMETYYQAKKRLFSMCGAAVINIDGEYGRRMAREISVPCVTFGTEAKDSRFGADNMSYGSTDGITYTLCDKNERYLIACPVAGSFAVSNTLAAASTARMFAIKPSVITSALAHCPQIPGRMERVSLPQGCDFQMFIDYAHTPDALEKVLKTLLAFVEPGGRLVVVFGCGGDRDSSKRPIMGRIATSLAGLTVITGDNSRTENPRAIICDILKGAADGSDCRVIERREAAIRYVINNHLPGDVILLAGKGHEDYEIDASGKHRFSEHEIIADTIERTKKIK